MRVMRTNRIQPNIEWLPLAPARQFDIPKDLRRGLGAVKHVKMNTGHPGVD
jgi:hypothetical protein